MADFEGARLNPPLILKYLIFMENLQKNQVTLINDLIKLTNQTPLYKFEPPRLSRHPGSAPGYSGCII